MKTSDAKLKDLSNDLQTGLVSLEDKSAELFIPFLLEDVREAVKDGEPVTVIGASLEKTACGALAGFIDDDVFAVTSLYVAQDYRRRGVGRALCNTLYDLLSEDMSVRIDLPRYAEDGSEEFLLALGFESYIPDQGMFVVPLSSLIDSMITKMRSVGDDISVLPFSKCTKETLASAHAQAIKQNAPVPANGLLDRNTDKDMSYLYMKGKEMVAFLVVETIGNESYVSGLYSKVSNPLVLMSLLQNGIKQGPIVHPEEGHLLYIPYTNMISYHIITMLIPDLTPAVRTFMK